MNTFNQIQKNLEYVKAEMSIPLSTDAILREFAIFYHGKKYTAFIVYYEGLASNESIDGYIMQSLHLLPQLGNESLKDTITDQLLSCNQLTVSNDFRDIFDRLNYGGCGLFVDTIDECFVLDVKNWKKRGISDPISENVIRGSQEAFIETMRTNTSLIRRLVRQEQLVCEGFKLGISSKTPCNLLYIKGKTNQKTIDEVRRRLNSVKADHINDSGELEQAIEDFSFYTSPQIIATERPDRASTALMEGRVVVVLDGTPFALIMPINAYDLFKTTDDRSLRFPYVNFVRVLRILSIITSLLLPSVFVAVCCFHQEAIPIHLLFAVSASRRAVPFSVITELILFEIAFEIIREASIRIPSPAGNAMGIIGGLIIGQSAIDANLVSPIVIIIVAVTGIGSFATPNYSLTFSFRILKYVYIVFASFAGFLGIALFMVIHLATLCDSQSFGMPFLAPFSKNSKPYANRLFIKPIWNRFGYIMPRKWTRGTNKTKTPIKKIDIK